MVRANYWRLVFLSSAHIFSVQLILPLLAPYFSSLGYSDSWISFVMGIFPFIIIFAGSAIGELSDEIGRTWTIRISLLLSAFVYVLYYLGFAWGIVLARVIDALAFTAIGVLLLSKIQDMLDDSKRGKFTGALLSIQTSVRMFAPVAGGLLADKFIGFPFLTTIGIQLALAFSLRKYKVKRKKPIKLHPWKNMGWFFKDTQLRPMAVLGPFMNSMQPVLWMVLPLFIVNDLEMSYAFVGIAAMSSSLGAVLQFFFGQLSDVIGRKKMILYGCLIRASALVYIAVSVFTYVDLLLVLVVFSVGGAMWNVSAWAYMSDIAEKQKKEGTMVGTYISISHIGQLSAFMLIGFVIPFLGYTGVFYLMGLIALVGVGISAYLFYNIKSPQASAA